MSARGIRRVVGAMVIVAVSAGAACSGRSDDAALPAQPRTPAVRYVAIGGSETEGHGARDSFRDAWPRVVFREHLDRSTVFVNLARDISSADELFAQIDEAAALAPTLVTIESDDLVRRDVDPAAFEMALRDATARLESAGADTVVLTTVRAFDGLPGYLACVDGDADAPGCRFPDPVAAPDVLRARTDALNRAIRSVADGNRVVVADVATAFARRAAEPGDESPIRSSGIALSPEGHRLLAAEVARALDRSDR